MGLAIGDRIPDFVLNDQHGKEFHSRDQINSQPLVLFFYPKDFTPGCTREACMFRDHYEDFTDLGAVVVGISSDSVSSHRRFAERLNLPFTLLSDDKGQLRKQFGIKGAFFNLLPGRETFVFDSQGILTHRYRDVRAANHMKEAIEALKALI